jgi:hypothetical protein
VEPRSTFVIRVRETTRGAAGFATSLWAIVITVCLFAIRVDRSHSTYVLVAVIATVLLGAYLGWHRRMGVIFMAPVVSWLFAWIPLLFAEVIHDGLLKGALYWLVLVTVGWLIIGTVEFIALMCIAWPFRLVSGLYHHDATVTIQNPYRSNDSGTFS